MTISRLNSSCSETRRGGALQTGVSLQELNKEPRAVAVEFSADAFKVRLADGRELTVPLEWFPRLRDASPEARAHCRLIGNGVGIHWEELDEDISVQGLL